MAIAWFIGDEVSAAGYRLAGARVLVPEKGRAAEIFTVALDAAELVLITLGCAAELQETDLQRAMRVADPLVLVVPDAANPGDFPNLGESVERVLGIDT